MILVQKIKGGWMNISESLPVDVKYTNPRIHFVGKYRYSSIDIKRLAMCSNEIKFKIINKTITVTQI